MRLFEFTEDNSNIKIHPVTVTDYHRGEMFGTKFLTVDGVNKAGVDVSILDDEVNISHIITSSDSQRRGYAKMLVDALFKEFPNKTITVSGMTDSGSAFFRSQYNVDDETGEITPKGGLGVNEAFDTDVEWVLDMDARNQQVYATKVDDAYIELTYKRIFPADVYIEFSRGGSMGVTGEGSQNKIFGAVINHVKQWVAKNKPPKIIFSAFKPRTGAFGAQDTTRSGLYRKMVQRFASQNGYSFDVEDIGSEDKFVLTRQNVQESGMIFSRKKGKGGGVKTTQKFTCTSGPRAGKRVSSLAQCFAPIDVAKRIQMKKTRARTAVRQARRARFTKRVDPSSLLTKMLNKARRPGKPKR